MKLNIVPAGTGIQWVRLGIKAFMRQPLALTALFFMYTAAATLLGLVPVFGVLLALSVAPAATLGFMAATQEAVNGRIPTPLVFLSAFRAGRAQFKSMLVLGVIYAVLLIGIALVVTAAVPLPPAPATPVPPTTPGMQVQPSPEHITAMLLAVALYLPVSILFWHAPALVHWHGITPVKSLFFSAVAWFRNWKAMTVFGLAWFGLVLAFLMLISTVALVTGGAQLSVGLATPLALLIAAMFSTSLFFTYRDSFVTDEPAPPAPQPPELPPTGEST